MPSTHERKAKSNPKERATPAAAGAGHVADPRAGRASLGPPLLIGGGASGTLLYLEVLLLALAGALTLLLMLTIRVSPNRLAGISTGLADQRGHAAAVIGVLLVAVMVGLLVAHLVGQA